MINKKQNGTKYENKRGTMGKGWVPTVAAVAEAGAVGENGTGHDLAREERSGQSQVAQVGEQDHHLFDKVPTRKNSTKTSKTKLQKQKNDGFVCTTTYRAPCRDQERNETCYLHCSQSRLQRERERERLSTKNVVLEAAAPWGAWRISYEEN